MSVTRLRELTGLVLGYVEQVHGLALAPLVLLGVAAGVLAAVAVVATTGAAGIAVVVHRVVRAAQTRRRKPAPKPTSAAPAVKGATA
jgi:ABC-type Na+ efflux pump permease subunit